MPKGKGIVLYSGGLDSLLTAKILIEQDIEIIGFHGVLPFYPDDFDVKELPQSKLAETIGLKLHYYMCGTEYLDMVKNPPHGYGKNMNPCIDCKIHFINKALELMEETGADFIATGEVVGQRPMSQLKHTMNHIVKETESKGKLLRPLSAKILKPTIPEIEGIVDREKLYGISGRSRKPQMELAEKFGITSYASPAGGCLFTDSYFSNKLKDLFDHHKDFDLIDIYLLTIGRHFRLNDNLKIIVGRKESENLEFEKYRNEADYLIEPDFNGPSVFVKGHLSDEDLELIGSMIFKYGKPPENSSMLVYKGDEPAERIGLSYEIDNDLLESMRI